MITKIQISCLEELPQKERDSVEARPSERRRLGMQFFQCSCLHEQLPQNERD
jgi:hypothetical protein